MPGPGGCLMGVCSGGCRSWGCLVPGGAWSGGVSAPRGCLVWRLCSGGGVPGGEPPLTASAAGGTHPTGMHSCYELNCLL